MYSETMLRSNTCWQCKHCEKTDYFKPKKRFCGVTRRWGNIIKGNWCKKWEYRQLPNPIASDGLPIKNRQPLDYRTAEMWNEVGRCIKPDAKGVEMHANRQSMKTYIYYLIEDTYEGAKHERF